MQGLTLGQGGHPAHPAAQFVPGPLGYQMVYGVAPGPSSLPHLAIVRLWKYDIVSYSIIVIIC